MENDHKSVREIRRADLARITGCNLETIRYYENIGVMPQPPRNANNHRSYDAGHIARLSFVMRARDLGFTLEEIRELLALVDGGMQTCGEVRTLAARHLESLRARIADMRRIERVLSETVAQCSGRDVPECAVIDALTRAA